jgi:hypothetical protein
LANYRPTEKSENDWPEITNLGPHFIPQPGLVLCEHETVEGGQIDAIFSPAPAELPRWENEGGLVESRVNEAVEASAAPGCPAALDERKAENA